MHVSPIFQISCVTDIPTDLLDDEQDPATLTALRAAETLGRPLGSPDFLDRLAARTGRDPRPGKRGRKKQKAG
jgi:putative transposase